MAHPGNWAPCGPRRNCRGSRSRLSPRGAVCMPADVWRCLGAHQSTPCCPRGKPMLARDRRRKTLNSNHLLPSGLALSGKVKPQPLGPCCIAWSRSQVRINGKGCGRKGIRHENLASKPMNMADTDLDPTRASPSSDAQEHRRTLARNGLDPVYGSRITSGYG